MKFPSSMLIGCRRNPANPKIDTAANPQILGSSSVNIKATRFIFKTKTNFGNLYKKMKQYLKYFIFCGGHLGFRKFFDQSAVFNTINNTERRFILKTETHVCMLYLKIPPKLSENIVCGGHLGFFRPISSF